MDCEVCLSENPSKAQHLLRTFDLETGDIEDKLEGIEFKALEGLQGIDLLFESEKHLKEAIDRLGIYAYSTGESMEEVVGRLLREKGLTLSTAESCTAGLLSARIVNVPGSSEYFLGGVVVYSNRLKVSLLGVREETLKRFGAVSKETCVEMLKGLRERFGTDTGIAITGIAGPGGSEHKPEGLTYIGVYLKDKTIVEKRIFSRGRNSNRFLSTQVALNELRKLLLKEEL
ncbi:MAG: nicotinamide-nucleotide amidohydrolase family protein [Aquificae bacterium]|nr:nicotinamide-nucleotide amidohydrolase family protein [Aquificota bacterium]